MARLTQARYPAQILLFFKLKMASPAILFLGIPRQGQVVILRPAGLQIFPRRDALGLTRKWDLRNNKWDVIIKLGSNYKKCTKHVLLYKILFLDIENFIFINCYERNVSLDFYVI